MANDKLRRRVASEAARLMYAREESQYFRAKMKAARRIYSGELRPGDLPSNREVRQQIHTFARRLQADRQTENLRQMRLAALRVMRILREFWPRLVGGALSGGAHPGSAVKLHVFSDSAEAVTAVLKAAGLRCEVRQKQVCRGDTEQICTRIRSEDRFPFELTIDAASLASDVLKSSATGRALEQASIDELERLIEQEHPNAPPEPKGDKRGRESFVGTNSSSFFWRQHDKRLPTPFVYDRFRAYEMLLLPLEHVKENPESHPEGDVLYHSLQVFELARESRPYDEEFLLAALLHDVGKAIDRRDHVAAALEALEGLITPRTAWLVEHHAEALALRDGTLGARSRRRLEASEDFEELLTLAECDALGRQTGVLVPEVSEALACLRQLAQECGE
jgi:hypothetical protein